MNIKMQIGYLSYNRCAQHWHATREYFESGFYLQGITDGTLEDLLGPFGSFLDAFHAASSSLKFLYDGGLI